MKRFIKCILLVVSAITLLVSSVNTTFCFVASKTDRLVNVFKPEEKITNGISVIKRVEHPLGEDYEIPQNIAFDFTLGFGKFYAETTLDTAQGKLKTDKDGNLSVKIKPDQPFTVDGIDAGTEVTVNEEEITAQGFTKKDDSKRVVTVKEVGYAQTEFINLYTPKSCTAQKVTLKGKKVLEGREFKKNDVFSFVLEQKQEGKWVKLDKQTITYNEENFKSEFDFTKVVSKLNFSVVGEYEFRIFEEKGTLKGIVYDATVNTFSVFVTDNDMDGKLEISSIKPAQNVTVTVKNNEEYSLDVVFNNTFKIPPPEDVDLELSVVKKVTNKGSYKRGADGFEFILVNTETANERTFTSNANGNAGITINVSEAELNKTLTYKLYEKQGDEKGVTYDTTVYDVQIKPYLSEDYEIVAEYYINGNKVEDLSFEFSNLCDISVPATGSDKMVYFWAILALLSGTSCILIIVTDRRKEG